VIAVTQVALGAATVLLVGGLLSWNVVLPSDVRDLQGKVRACETQRVARPGIGSRDNQRENGRVPNHDA
jgi:hypothetical protein